MTFNTDLDDKKAPFESDDRRRVATLILRGFLVAFLGEVLPDFRAAGTFFDIVEVRIVALRLLVLRFRLRLAFGRVSHAYRYERGILKCRFGRKQYPGSVIPVTYAPISDGVVGAIGE